MTPKLLSSDRKKSIYFDFEYFVNMLYKGDKYIVYYSQNSALH